MKNDSHFLVHFFYHFVAAIPKIWKIMNEIKTWIKKNYLKINKMQKKKMVRHLPFNLPTADLRRWPFELVVNTIKNVKFPRSTCEMSVLIVWSTGLESVQDTQKTKRIINNGMDGEFSLIVSVRWSRFVLQ